MTEEYFYTLTPAEINRYISAYNKRKSIDDKNRATILFSAVNHLSVNIGMMLSGKSKELSIYDIYPYVFSDDEIEEYNTRQSIANITNFANAFNKKKDGEK